MSSETVSLLPCPFCGAEMVLTEREEWVHPWNDTCPADDIHISYRDEPRLSAWNRRYKPVASEVEIMPLEWKGPDENTAYGEQGGFVYTVMSPNRTPGWHVWVHLKPSNGSASIGGGIVTVRAETREAAIAAAEADYRNRILSALLPKATAPVVSEPASAQTVDNIVIENNNSHGVRITGNGGAKLSLDNKGTWRTEPGRRTSSTQPQPKAVPEVTEEGLDRTAARVQSLEEALRQIRELNMSDEDENGHRWANSDMINQTIVLALSQGEKP